MAKTKGVVVAASKSMSDPLHIKYRPASLSDVIGQDGIVRSLSNQFASERVPHTFLFTGPSGCGKTTLARIVAAMLNCTVIEVDAARFSGIEAMRGLLDGAQYAGLGESGRKFYIIDEAHALSKATWQTLLLSTEEPPSHLYFAFCTTEPDKVPKTVQTRAHAYDVKPVKWDLLSEYLNFVNVEEKLGVLEDFIDLAARKADGSVRQALVYLSILAGVADRADALKLVEDYDAQEEGPIALARMLVSGRGASWPNARKLVEGFAEAGLNPETVRLTILNYAAASLMKEDKEKGAAQLLAVVQNFSVPCNPSERMAPILVSVGSLLLG